MSRRLVAWSLVTIVVCTGCASLPPDPPDAFARDEGSSTPWLSMVDDAAPGDAGVDASLGIPCAIEVVLQGRCQPCHDASPLAPPSVLVSLRDFDAISALDTSRTVAQVAYERVGAAGERRMPPAMAVPLDDAQRTMLLSWLRDGAPAGTPCPLPEPTESSEFLKPRGIDAGIPP